MKHSLFITDFDGTLLNDEKKISPKDFKALEHLREDGIATVVATGRSIASFEKALREMEKTQNGLRWPFDYLIFSTGAGVMQFDNRQILYQKSLAARHVEKVVQYFESIQMDYMVLKPIPDTHYFEYRSFGKDNPDFQYRLSLYSAFATPLNDHRRVRQDATEVLAILPEGADRAAVAHAQSALPQFSVIPVTSPLDHRSLWIEVFHQDVCKSKSAEWLCSQLGVDRRNVAAVGNDYNDKDLLEWAGKAYAVRNAPSVLTSGFETVASNNHSGISAAIEKWRDAKSGSAHRGSSG